MFVSFRLSRRFIVIFLIIILSATMLTSLLRSLSVKTAKQNLPQPETVKSNSAKKDYIKWVDFGVTAEAMQAALKLDTESQGTESPLNWIELLAVLGAKYGGDFKRFKTADLSAVANRVKGGESIADITRDMKYYPYYQEAYSAVLSGFAGEYENQKYDESNNPVWEKQYGLKAFSPIAAGYGYSHSDDFGNKRSFGFARKHLGHDMMGSLGTPIVAVEGGVVEALGWNRYGGWRIGIRSFDSRRYYYYAHLQKDKPFADGLEVGATVQAGDLIGFMGRTGYSDTENVNNIETVHLHFGMQLVFDESQKECLSEIWIDTYDIVWLLDSHRSSIRKTTDGWKRVYPFTDLDYKEWETDGI